MSGLLVAAMLSLSAADVVRVHDGDTITIRYQGAEQRVRFRGIDTPELWKPRCRREARLAAQARSFVQSRLRAAGTIRLVEVDTRSDPYGRWLAWVYVDGQSLAALTVQAGLGRRWRAGGGPNKWCSNRGDQQMSDDQKKEKKGRAPDYHAIQPIESGEKTYWNRIGAAWRLEEKDGLKVQLSALPVDGDFVLMPPRQQDE